MKPDVKLLLERHKKRFAENTIFCSNIESIIDEIVTETGLPRIEIRKIIDSEMRILKEIINNQGLITPDSKFENFKSIRLIRLGSFKPSEAKFKRIQEYLIDKENKDDKEN